MKLLYRSMVWMGLLLGTGLLAQTNEMLPMQGLRVPISYYPDGTLKDELLADTARMREDGTIVATGIVFRVYATNATMELQIQAADAVVDREARKGHSERPVSLIRKDLLLTGEGFVWNGVAETIRILRKVRLTFASKMFTEQEGSWKDAFESER